MSFFKRHKKPCLEQDQFICGSIKLILLLLVICFTYTNSYSKNSDELAETISKANNLYDSAKYKEAALLYEKAASLSRRQGETSSYYFNAACCWAKLNNTSSAFINLNRVVDIIDVDIDALNTEKDLEYLKKLPQWNDLLERNTQLPKTKRLIFFWGLYIGIFCIMFIYNLFLYFSIKEPAYLFYSISILFYIHFEAYRTFDIGYYFSDLFFWVYYLLPLKPFYLFLTGTVIFYLIFTQRFLNLKQLAPKSNFIIKLFIWALILLYMFALFSKAQIKLVDSILILFAYIFTFIVAIYCWRKKYRPAKFFILADTLLLIGITLRILESIGVADTKFSFFVYQADNIGFLSFSILLSLALGDKIKTLQKDREEANKKAMEKLEAMVIERTLEITQQKEIIEVKQKEVLDSIHYAKRIQIALLPSKKYIERIFNKLKK